MIKIFKWIILTRKEYNDIEINLYKLNNAHQWWEINIQRFHALARYLKIEYDSDTQKWNKKVKRK